MLKNIPKTSSIALSLKPHNFLLSSRIKKLTYKTFKNKNFTIYSLQRCNKITSILAKIE